MGGCPSADTVRHEHDDRPVQRASAASGPTRAIVTSDGRPTTPQRGAVPAAYPQGRGSLTTPLMGALPLRPHLSILAPSTPDTRPRGFGSHPDIVLFGSSPDVIANTNAYLELERQRISIPETPTGKEAELYQYFCPICMLHFREIWQTRCCSNSICILCALAHVKMRSTDPSVVAWYSLPIDEVIDGVDCPACNSAEVRFSRVSTLDKARSYQESPHTRDLFAAMEARNRGLGVTVSSMHTGPSRSNMNVSNRPPTGTGAEHRPSSRSQAASDTASMRAVRNHPVAELRRELSEVATPPVSNRGQHVSLEYPIEVEHDEDLKSESHSSRSSVASSRPADCPLPDQQATSSSSSLAAVASSIPTRSPSRPIESSASAPAMDDVVLGYSGPSQTAPPAVAAVTTSVSVSSDPSAVPPAEAQSSSLRPVALNAPTLSSSNLHAQSSCSIAAAALSTPNGNDPLKRPDTAPTTRAASLVTRSGGLPSNRAEVGEEKDDHATPIASARRVATPTLDALARRTSTAAGRSARLQSPHGWKEPTEDAAASSVPPPVRVLQLAPAESKEDVEDDNALFLPSPQARHRGLDRKESPGTRAPGQSYRATLAAHVPTPDSSAVASPSDATFAMSLDAAVAYPAVPAVAASVDAASSSSSSSSALLHPLGDHARVSSDLHEESFSFDGSVSFSDATHPHAVHPMPPPPAAEQAKAATPE